MSKPNENKPYSFDQLGVRVESQSLGDSDGSKEDFKVVFVNPEAHRHFTETIQFTQDELDCIEEYYQEHYPGLGNAESA